MMASVEMELDKAPLGSFQLSGGTALGGSLFLLSRLDWRVEVVNELARTAPLGSVAMYGIGGGLRCKNLTHLTGVPPFKFIPK